MQTSKLCENEFHWSKCKLLPKEGVRLLIFQLFTLYKPNNNASEQTLDRWFSVGSYNLKEGTIKVLIERSNTFFELHITQTLKPLDSILSLIILI